MTRWFIVFLAPSCQSEWLVGTPFQTNVAPHTSEFYFGLNLLSFNLRFFVGWDSTQLNLRIHILVSQLRVGCLILQPVELPAPLLRHRPRQHLLSRWAELGGPRWGVSTAQQRAQERHAGESDGQAGFQGAPQDRHEDRIGDLPAVYDLWRSCMPDQFSLSRPSLQRLLQRDGYAKHFVARASETGEVVGFCATYITYQDSKGEVLVGSIAAILVKEGYRGRGIGRILHDEGLRGFQKTRGVSRLQLGSTFPRLLYGLPVGHPSEGWFARRGWKMDCTAPGTGQEVADWVLAFDEWPTGGFPPVGLTFRPCGFADFDQVLEVVEQESERKGNMAWYDQYAKLADTFSMGDIIIAARGDAIAATAITYIMNSENPSAEDLPWARTISEDTGGVTCICITDDDPATRDSVMVRLLDACVQVLRQQGMNRMYIDAVRGGDAGFQSIGFQKWASYRDVWRVA